MYNIFNTPYGQVTLYANEKFIGKHFLNGIYWDEDVLLSLKPIIDPNRNILEIGGHCGTSTLVYSSFLNTGKVYVYEPQKNMYNLLVHNIENNNLQDKIIPYNSGVFCYNGTGRMNNIDIDGGGGIVEKRYNEEIDQSCNFGGVSLGNDGEKINLVTIDAMQLENIGFIHCDAQGSENFIFSKGMETIKRCRPFILYENNASVQNKLYMNVCESYPEYKEESVFDIKKYCIEELGYYGFVDHFNGGIDTLLVPHEIAVVYK